MKDAAKMSKHLTPKEFDKFMQKRIEEKLKNNPKKIPFVIGAIILPLDFEKIWPEKIIQVECCSCGIPIYISESNYEIIQNYFDPIFKDKHPYYCMFCVPPEIVKGTTLQDMAAVLQHTGEDFHE